MSSGAGQPGKSYFTDLSPHDMAALESNIGNAPKVIASGNGCVMANFSQKQSRFSQNRNLTHQRHTISPFFCSTSDKSFSKPVGQERKPQRMPQQQVSLAPSLHAPPKRLIISAPLLKKKPTTHEQRKPIPSTSRQLPRKLPQTLPELKKVTQVISEVILESKNTINTSHHRTPSTANQIRSSPPTSHSKVPRPLPNILHNSLPLKRKPTAQKDSKQSATTLESSLKPSMSLPLKKDSLHSPIMTKKPLPTSRESKRNFFAEFDPAMEEILLTMPIPSKKNTESLTTPSTKIQSPYNEIHKKQLQNGPSGLPTLPKTYGNLPVKKKVIVGPTLKKKVLSEIATLPLKLERTSPSLPSSSEQTQCLQVNINKQELPLVKKKPLPRISQSSSLPFPSQSVLPVHSGLPQQQEPKLPQNTMAEQVEIRLLSTERFAIPSTRNQCLHEVYSQIHDSEHSESEGWSFLLRDYHKLVHTLRIIPKVSVHPLPAHIVDVFVNHSFSIEKKTLDGVSPSLLSQLMPYQQSGVLFALQRKGRVMICDEMGLGKTVQSIAISSAYSKEWPVLVICPSSLREGWGQQFVRWLPELVHESEINVVYTAKNLVLEGKICVISYAIAAAVSKQLKKKRFKVIIVDESHLLKSPKAKRTQEIVPLIKEAHRAILLSGTPAVSRPSELFSQLNAVNPSLFRNNYDFATRYCDGHATQFGFDMKGSSNLEELHLLLNHTIMIRRLKDNVTQLPPKTRKQVPVLITDAEHSKILAQEFNKLKTFKKDAFSKSDRKAKAARTDIMCAIGALFRVSGTYKIPAILEYLEEQLLGDQKLLLFAYHQNVIRSACCSLESRNIDFICIDGKTAQKKRQTLVNHFQNSPSCRVAVLSITAAGVGITLTAATKVIFAELYWVPGYLLQAEDRAHRIGQKHPITVEYLIGKGTLDEHIWNLVNTKLDVVGKTLDGAAAAMNAPVGPNSLVPEKFDPSSELYGSFIDNILNSVSDSVDRADERRRERKAKADEEYQQQQHEKQKKLLSFRPNLVHLREPEPLPRTDTIVVRMDDDSQPSPPSSNSFVGTKRNSLEAGGDGEAKLNLFAFQPKKKRKIFVE